MRSLSCGWFILLALVGCTGSAANPTATASSPTPLATAIPATHTASATVVNMETPTIAPETTATSIPSRTPTPMTCWAAGGRIEHGELASGLLRQPLAYTLYLPPCYDQLSHRHYPTLYLIHGQSYTDDQWVRLGATHAADELIARGEISSLIIVMPRNRTWEQPTEDPFGKALVAELMPFIDANYRTIPARLYRAVGGLSRGAGWAVHLGLSQWQLFGAIGAHSLPVFWSDTRHISRWLDEIPPEAYPRIYIDIGDKDRPPILESALWFEQLLTRKRIPHEWYLFSGYHEEAYWQSHVEQYLRWYTQGW